MKKTCLFLFSLSLFMLHPGYSQMTKKSSATDTKKASVADTKKTMAWTTKSDQALKLASNGVQHLMNIELSQAYSDFSDAIKLDPNFTVPLVFMTNMAQGTTRKAYADQVAKSLAGKTEGEKIFASLINENITQDDRRATWAKLHGMFPDGTMIGHYYVITRETPEERFNAAQEYLEKNPEAPAMHNLIAYYYLLDKKDNEMAKKHFEKYIALYPEGCNPYDSMGEFYLTTGDTTNAEKYYKMALEKYPFNNSSLNALQKINENKAAKEQN